jgi:hypothetical protein
MYNLNAEWKTINNFPNYLISNNGSVFSLKSKKILKTNINNGGYKQIGLMKDKIEISFKIHRLVCEHFGIWNPDLTVDHINGNKSDNTISNLRIATQQQQCFNQKVKHNNKLGVKGVQFRFDKYTSRILINGKRIHLGTFETLEEAKEAYDTKAREIQGEFFKE